MNKRDAQARAEELNTKHGIQGFFAVEVRCGEWTVVSIPE